MLRQILDQLQDYFGISRKQARGAFLLIILSILLLWSPFVFRRWILPMFPSDVTPVDRQRMDSIVSQLKKETNEQSSGHEDHYIQEKNTLTTPVRLFKFDPNTASIKDLQTLGIAPFIARRIDKFRSKGGKFRKKEDLLHIYDFPQDVYNKLESYIDLPVQEVKTSKSYTQKPGQNYPEEKRAYIKPVIVPFDINTADTTQLIRLKGIGSKLSVRIIKFRDALGGFHSKAQYQEIFGLDSLALSELQQYAGILSPVRKINLNTASAEEMAQHTYLRNKRINTVIVNYRTQHGPYQSADDLKKIKVIDEKTIEKLAPYLNF